MRTGYVDHYVVCPLYSREESNLIRKIHCEGYKKGVYVQLYFRKSKLKLAHKSNYCKSDYKKCPLYQAVLDYQKEKDNE
jgi:hypothetical protein